MSNTVKDIAEFNEQAPAVTDLPVHFRHISIPSPKTKHLKKGIIIGGEQPLVVGVDRINHFRRLKKLTALAVQQCKRENRSRKEMIQAVSWTIDAYVKRALSIPENTVVESPYIKVPAEHRLLKHPIITKTATHGKENSVEEQAEQA